MSEFERWNVYKVTVKVLVLLIFLLFSEGCTADMTASATIATTRIVLPTETVVVLTATPTETAVVLTPTPSPTLVDIPLPEKPLPTASRTPIPMSTPTPTPEPTMTTQPTPLSLLDHVDLPVWVSDPSVNVLLLGRTLFAPQINERFDIPLDGNVSVRWSQNEDGLYIRVGYYVSSDDLFGRADEIYVMSGEVKHIETPRQLTPIPLSVFVPNGRFQAHIVGNEGRPTTVYLIDEESGSEIELSNSFDSEYPNIGDVKWSPEGQMLAIERTRSIDDPAAFYGKRTTSALIIYSPNGTKLGQYVDIPGRGITWSPVSPYHLLTQGGDLYDNLPCILDVTGNSYTCLNQILTWREEQDVSTYNYKWSPDGNKIAFVYWNEASVGGLCYTDLTSNKIGCLVTREDWRVDKIMDQFDPGYHVRDLFVTGLYYWSPDGNDIALSIDPNSPGSDDGAWTTAAIVDSAGEHLQLIRRGWLLADNPWRPAIVGSN